MAGRATDQKIYNSAVAPGFSSQASDQPIAASAWRIKALPSTADQSSPTDKRWSQLRLTIWRFAYTISNRYARDLPAMEVNSVKCG
jgi:hypothetical protein